ncbi:EF-hand calcium-binding domain-containing protein 6-like isoform X3 [Dreissena polymorpha]|uniref:EF-hand calcium-binding domain-containing protein 6-like isoform X3 n=1 Tax=Dreissena polymorpha TaxID=45954 RepID=UPI00226442D7|nr:EF-hand calcium-binding domain-containing protein 6-like isoform X3 [Dreissena polymorpha]
MPTTVGLQRAVSSASPMASPGRLPNLPVIEHPMSRLGDRNDLAVRGSSTYGRERGTPSPLQRSQTDVGYKASKIDVNNLRKSTPERILNWPPAQPTYRTNSSIEYLKGPGKPHVKSKEYNYQPRNTQELIDLIREKFGTGYYGIRHLFKSNDPAGKGSVSREALQRILYTLCGYITPDQYTKLLRTMHLEGKTPIHFDTFVQYFKDTEDKKNWVSALQASGMHPGEPSYPEGYLRRGDMRIHDPYTSMPFSDAIFKEKCKSKNFDARRVFPPAVFEVNGLILPPQLREAYATLGIYMSDEDFNKLWQRYDKEGTGAIHRDDFFRVCGLDPQGLPRQAAPYTPRGAAYPMSRQRPHSEIGHTNGTDNTTNELKKILKNDAENLGNITNREAKPIEIPTAPEESPKDEPDAKEKKVETARKIEIKRNNKPAPKLDSIVDSLHFKFEETYQAMLTAFQLFDFLNDSFISKIDFRRVLMEFGFNIAPAELDHFLKRNGMRAIKGQINYRDFLNKFQSKSLQSLTARTAADQAHPFNTDGSAVPDTMTAEHLEARLIDTFHADFIKLLTHFRQCDKYNLHVITAHEFRSGIEKRLGYSMTESQWEALKQEVGEDKDGLIQYTRFLELFDITPGSWNVRQEGGITVTQVGAADMPPPPQVERLQERAKTEMVPPPAHAPADRGQSQIRSIDEIKVRLDELFRIRFHTFDKHFKAMDRKMTGRMSKWQFGALLKMCGLSLHPQELDRVWATLNVSTDGMYSYSTLIQHFVNYKVPHEEKENIIYEDTTELVETARRIQRERREEQMKRDHLARTLAREKNVGWVPELPGQKPENSPPVNTASTAISRASSVPSVPASRASFASVQSVRTKSLLVKIRTDVINNWDGLKSVFKYIDRNGTSFIPINEMKEIMTSMQFPMDEEEKAELCKRFDTERNGRFNYMRFMKCYAQRTSSKHQPPGYTKFSHQLQAQMEIRGRLKRPTVQECIELICEKLFKEHRTLRRAFSKLDRGHKGYLTVHDFRLALKQCEITFSNEDFYHVLTEFDQNMDGKISYDIFLKTLLAV